MVGLVRSGRGDLGVDLPCLVECFSIFVDPSISFIQPIHGTHKQTKQCYANPVLDRLDPTGSIFKVRVLLVGFVLGAASGRIKQ